MASSSLLKMLISSLLSRRPWFEFPTSLGYLRRRVPDVALDAQWLSHENSMFVLQGLSRTVCNFYGFVSNYTAELKPFAGHQGVEANRQNCLLNFFSFLHHISIAGPRLIYSNLMGVVRWSSYVLAEGFVQFLAVLTKQ
jgi:hypothetical protein